MKKRANTNEPKQSHHSKKTIREIIQKNTTLRRVLLGAGITFFVIGVTILAWRPVQDYMREQKMSELLEGIEEGIPTMIVERDAFSIPGEGYETFEAVPAEKATAVSIETAMETAALPDDVVLTALGTITIDEIDLFLPLLDDATVVPLRYGAGMLKGTAFPGEEGNCVVLGHRMKAYGSLFNRLGEMSIDDSIVIQNMDQIKFTYVVDVIIMKLDPSDLADYIDISSGSGKQLTLITCTPTGVGSHRLIIIAHLQE